MQYEYWFATLKGISNKRKQEIRKRIPSAELLYNIEETELRKHNLQETEYKIILENTKNKTINKEYEKLVREGIACITMSDARYPKRLRNIPNAPYALFVKGELPEEESPTVAIVGARECSAYGRSMAEEFARVLVGAGVQIISGMARGIDGASQMAALEAGGKSFGVLGCGVDICYPREKIELYMKLQNQGGILSELPPGTAPQKQFFPARNRIISGLADVVLVMEAKQQSGSLITADMALEQGKDVYALPGPIDSLLSRGCNELIRQGAGILLGSRELMEDLGFSYEGIIKNQKLKKLPLETKENIVYSCLGFYPQNPESLICKTGLTAAELLSTLMSLELKGYAREIAKNQYVKEE